jgi:hypothetical protein
MQQYVKSNTGDTNGDQNQEVVGFFGKKTDNWT